MAEAPFIFLRRFPAAAQNGVGTGVLINDSEIKFRAQAGLVYVWYTVHFVQASATSINQVGIVSEHAGLTLQDVAVSSTWLDGTVGRRVSAHAFFVVFAAADNAFLRIRTNLAAGTVDIPALQGWCLVQSFTPNLVAGPIVTLP